MIRERKVNEREGERPASRRATLSVSSQHLPGELDDRQ